MSKADTISFARSWLESEGYRVDSCSHPVRLGYHLVASKDSTSIKVLVSRVYKQKNGKFYAKKTTDRATRLLGNKTLWVDPLNNKASFDHKTFNSKEYKTRSLGSIFK